jgi:two-component system chemotaxis response regulator CheB
VPRRLVVIGGSAGGLDALRQLVAGLPPDFDAPILVVLHLAPHSESALAEILSRAGPLPAARATHNDPLVPGRILVAPPDRHLVVHRDSVHLSNGPRENRHRPAVDPLFATAARWHGPAVIGVVLSGVLDDGAAGAAAIAAQDGVVVVQDPEDAQCAGMPTAALRAVRRAQTARAREIGPLLARLVREPAVGTSPHVSDLVAWEVSNVDGKSAAGIAPPRGVPAALGCPECQGGMFEVSADAEVHYVCHVGHSWSPESLIDAQREASEAALYNAASKLLEEAAVLRRLAALGDNGETPQRSDRGALVSQAERAEQRAAEIRDMIRQAK